MWHLKDYNSQVGTHNRITSPAVKFRTTWVLCYRGFVERLWQTNVKKCSIWIKLSSSTAAVMCAAMPLIHTPLTWSRWQSLSFSSSHQMASGLSDKSMPGLKPRILNISTNIRVMSEPPTSILNLQWNTGACLADKWRKRIIKDFILLNVQINTMIC